MQARIIDFASKKVVNSLRKIEKDDVKKAFASVHSKFKKSQNKKKQNSMKLKVTSKEKYCEMLKEEFNFSSTQNEKNNKVESSYFVAESSDGKTFKTPLKLCKLKLKSFKESFLL